LEDTWIRHLLVIARTKNLEDEVTVPFLVMKYQQFLVVKTNTRGDMVVMLF
jgi:hypothetical protein